ncbi:hypothetical protein TNCV_5055661 [Trichonephila clavipes]|nr:hypothetical protein TNCV_5055661 [Trichonephila clavipes]
MAGGNLRLLHVNKIREYKARVQTVGVIYDIDDEFGEIYETPTVFLQLRRMTKHWTELRWITYLRSN